MSEEAKTEDCCVGWGNKRDGVETETDQMLYTGSGRGFLESGLGCRPRQPPVQSMRGSRYAKLSGTLGLAGREGSRLSDVCQVSGVIRRKPAGKTRLGSEGEDMGRDGEKPARFVVGLGIMTAGTVEDPATA